MELSVPGLRALGLAQVATLELMPVLLPDLVERTVSLPVHVKAVPGDVAAGRVADPVMWSEVLFQQTQRTKRESSRLLSEGRVTEAAEMLRRTSERLQTLAASVAAADELLGEAYLLSSLADEVVIESSRAAKMSSSDATRESRTRGR